MSKDKDYFDILKLKKYPENKVAQARKDVFNTHDHTHKLDVACLTCVIQRVRERDRLLAFVRDIKNYEFDDGMELPAKEHYGQNIYNAATQLLKELGFEND